MHIISPNGTWLTDWPKDLKGDGWSTTQATREQCEAIGYREATPEEVAAKELADAQAAEQAAQFAFPQPEVVCPVLDAAGNPTGTARLLVDASGQLVVVTDTASPQRPWAVQLAEFGSKAAKRNQNLSAAKSEAAAANSVPALRAAVAKLIEAIE